MLPKVWGAPHKSIVRDDYENDVEEADRWLGRFERKVDPKLLHSEHKIGCGNDGRLLHNKGCTQ